MLKTPGRATAARTLPFRHWAVLFGFICSNVPLLIKSESMADFTDPNNPNKCGPTIQSFAAQEYIPVTSAKGTFAYSGDYGAYKIKDLPAQLKKDAVQVQTPNEDRVNFHTPFAVMSIAVCVETTYYLAIPASSMCKDGPPVWVTRARWVSTDTTITIENDAAEIEVFNVYSKTYKHDEILRLRALCDCSEKVCPLNYLLFYKKTDAKSAVALPAVAVCSSWGDPHITTFGKTKFEIGGGWNDAIKTQDCSVRVQVLAPHTNFKVKQIFIRLKDSVVGLQLGLNVFVRHQGANWKDITIDTKSKRDHTIVTNEKLGFKFTLSNKYWNNYKIEISSRSLQERVGGGFCGEVGTDLGKTANQEIHDVLKGVAECDNLKYTDGKVGVSSVIHATRVPDDEVLFTKFDLKSGNTNTRYLPNKGYKCADHFCKSSLEHFMIGDAIIPSSMDPTSATCTEDDGSVDFGCTSVARATCKDNNWKGAITECAAKYLSGGAMGKDCVMDSCLSKASVIGYDESDATTEDLTFITKAEPTDLTDYVVTNDDETIQYATLDFAPVREASTDVPFVNNLQIPKGWSIVTQDPKIQGIASMWNTPCLYLDSEDVVIGDGCDRGNFISEPPHYSVSGGRVMIERKIFASCKTSEYSSQYTVHIDETDQSGVINSYVTYKDSWVATTGKIESNYDASSKFTSLHAFDAAYTSSIWDHAGNAFDRQYDLLKELRFPANEEVDNAVAVFIVNPFEDKASHNEYACVVGVRKRGGLAGKLTATISNLAKYDLKWDSRALFQDQVRVNQNTNDYCPMFKGPSLQGKLVFNDDNFGAFDKINEVFNGMCVGPIDAGGVEIQLSAFENIGRLVYLTTDGKDNNGKHSEFYKDTTNYQSSKNVYNNIEIPTKTDETQTIVFKKSCA